MTKKNLSKPFFYKRGQLPQRDEVFVGSLATLGEKT